MGASGSTEEKIDRVKVLEDQEAEYRLNKEPLQKPWREYPEYPDGIFSQNTKDRLLQKILDISPPDPCKSINIMVMGKIGTGKSSFINTLFTVLRNNGQLSTIASPHGINVPTTTKRFHEVTLKTFEDGKKIRIYDCRGVHCYDWAGENYKDDLIKTVDGCTRKNYQFQEYCIQKDSVFFNPNPTISDKMHCVLYVTDSNQVQDYSSVLKQVKEHVVKNEIPLRVILTKVDQLNLCGFHGDLSGIFRSRQMKLKADLAERNFGIQHCQVLPIANYVSGMEQNITQDVLALLTIDNILQEAIAYIKNETEVLYER